MSSTNIQTIKDKIDTHAQEFDGKFPEYADNRYGEIANLVNVYRKEWAEPFINENGECLNKLLSLIKPIIAIKNYKSQIPFPEKLDEVIRCVISIISTTPNTSEILKNHDRDFKKLLETEGFQLPTVSAIFHFCHPSYFPIVDKNVAKACALLKETYRTEFSCVETPSLPAPNTSLRNKINKYIEFIKFINKVKILHGGDVDYRHIDKALMVIGSQGHL